MLLKSPINGREVHQLGVDLSGAHAELPSYSEARANVAIYLACLFMLRFGRRDLVPLSWAWAKCSAELHFQHWTPQTSELGPSIEGAVEFCKRLEDCIIDNRISTLISLERDDPKNSVNVAHAISQIASRGMTFKSQFTTGDPVAFIAHKLNLPSEVLTIMSFVSLRSGMATMTSMLCQQAASEPSNAQPDMSKAQAMTATATHRLASILGGDYACFSALVVRVFERLDACNDAKMATVWETCVESIHRHNAALEVREATAIPNARQRRDYRWRNGCIDAPLAFARDECFEMTTQDALREIIKHIPPTFSTDLVHTVFQYGEGVASQRLSQDRYSVVSFMTTEDFERFQELDFMETDWEIARRGGALVGDRFSDDSLHALALDERRLWGEKAISLTTAFLVRKGDVEQMRFLASVKGINAVTWKNEVLDFSTVTLNDCHQAPFALPATSNNLTKAVLVLCVAQAGKENTSLGPNSPGLIPLFAQTMFGISSWVHFVQIQIHERLSSEHMESWEVVSTK